MTSKAARRRNKTQNGVIAGLDGSWEVWRNGVLLSTHESGRQAWRAYDIAANDTLSRSESVSTWISKKEANQCQ